MNRIYKLFYVTFFSFTFFAPTYIYAADNDMEAKCQEISGSDKSCENLSAAECQSMLQKCADYYDSESAKIEKDLTKTREQKNTLSSQIAGLKKKITPYSLIYLIC